MKRLRMHGIALAFLMDRDTKAISGWLGEKRHIRQMQVREYKNQSNDGDNGLQNWYTSERLNFKERLVIGFFKKHLME